MISRNFVMTTENALSALNILLVDDDQNLVTTLSPGLRKAMGDAISVTTSFSGADALSMLATQSFDVVISDCNMPGLSGLDLLDKISQDHRDMTLILITAYATDGLEEEVRRLGIGYITKPFEPSRLAEIIQGAEIAKTKGIREHTPSRLISSR